MSNFDVAVDGPYILKKNGKEYKFPHLPLKAYGDLVSLMRSNFMERLELIATKKKLKGVEAATYISRSAIPDYEIGHVQEWGCSIDGSVAVVRASLMQDGKGFEQQEEVLNVLSPQEIRDASQEITGHYYRPSNRATVDAANKKSQDEKKE